VRFILFAPVLNGGDTDFILIDRLVDRLADEVHQVGVQDPELLQESSWYQKARATRRKVLMSAIAKPPRVANDSRGPHAKVVEVLDTQSAKLADRLAHTPLLILVEDRESDGVFLDIVVEELGWPDLQTLWANGKLVTPRAVEIETAGGKGAIPQRVERIVRDAAEESKPHRLFVLCDSDARWPGDDGQLGRMISAVRDTCTKYGVPHHVWRKRCTENYISDEIFEAVRDDPRNLNHVDRFNALLRRSFTQRDHFPVKDGLSAAERADAVRAGLYSASEDEDLTLLEKPLFPKRPRPMLLISEERRGSFTATGLQIRDGSGELDALLLAIAQEL
jgi:hypothetical protein